MFMMSQIWAGTTNFSPFNRGNGRSRVINATINYVLNDYNRFWGYGDSENGLTVCVVAVQPYLIFKTRR